ncbi:HD domain-containing protein [Oceanobacillus rekensis]|uniref:HD domain-containing protein n=1 Tax=Oceanobacillus rekensis TaxID=937927 RepID=UPI000B430C2E|nr:HD domain-containing protein [Oceanobacillus rekensis]
MKDKQLAKIRDFIFQLFHTDVTGHDFFHMERVANMAKQIALKENADPFICEVAAWLHDVGDKKLFSEPDKSIEEMHHFLESIFITNSQINTIDMIIHSVSFSKGRIPETLEGKIVQDSDRLDAIGAIGIARTFAYGGADQQMIYHPDNKSTSIQHFHDKLLRLKDLMHTETAKNIAFERHQFMENFLKQFRKEWN